MVLNNLYDIWTLSWQENHRLQASICPHMTEHLAETCQQPWGQSSDLRQLLGSRPCHHIQHYPQEKTQKSMNRGAWLATVYGVAKSQTWLSKMITTNSSYSLDLMSFFFPTHLNPLSIRKMKDLSFYKKILVSPSLNSRTKHLC